LALRRIVHCSGRLSELFRCITEIVCRFLLANRRSWIIRFNTVCGGLHSIRHPIGPERISCGSRS